MDVIRGFKFLVLAFLAVFGTARAGLSVTPIPAMGLLPDKGITQIFRDDEGYMWYATLNGLCRDDGYDVKVVRAGNGDHINWVDQDSNGHILLATDKGAYTVDKRSLKAEQLDSARLGSRFTTRIFSTSDGDIWVGQKGRLQRYDNQGNWKKCYELRDRSGAPTNLSGFCQGRDGSIYITSYSRGVYEYEAEADKFEMSHPIDADVPLGQIIQDRTEDYFWIVDFRGNIYRFNPNDANEYVRSPVRAFGNDGGERIELIAITQDFDEGNIWGVSQTSLLAFKPEADGRLTPVNHPELREMGNEMLTSVCATPGAIWVGKIDFDSSIIRLDNNVKSQTFPSIEEGFGASPVIIGIAKADKPGRYWMLQNRLGLMLADANTGELTYHGSIKGFDPQRLRGATEMALSPKHKGVWASKEGFFYLVAISNKGMQMEFVDSVGLDHYLPSTAKLTKLHEDRQGRLWAGYTGGLFAYDLNTRRPAGNFPDLGYISCIIEQGSDTIMALSKEKGPIRIIGGEISELPKAYSEIQRGTAMGIAPNGSIWIGTDDGRVYECPAGGDAIIEHTSGMNADNLPGIKQIAFNADGRGWIVTDLMIVEFDPEESFKYIYEAGKEIPLVHFTSRTPAITEEGAFVVGGAGGIAEIRPKSARDAAEERKATISDIKSDGKSLLTSRPRLWKGDLEIELEPNDDGIEISFTANDNLNPEKISYAYRLDGANGRWHYTGEGINKAYLGELGPGRHELEVKTIDEFMHESGAITTYGITRKPHAYETWWAMCIYIFIGIGLIAAGMAWYKKYLSRKNEELWADSKEMAEMRTYLVSPTSLPEEEYKKLDKIFLEKATRTVEENLGEQNFDVNVLAEKMNMSRSTFTRKIKSITGKTPLDFIRDIKMEHARRLLESDNYTVSQVSDMLGFSDRRYFTSCFRKAAGMSPREYQASRNSSEE
ncbi:MAG: helix-turn-helix domain-containing protein [Clostridium sp.]|nr:helix-turn-helix domain-containing protein [Clostridium sp.]